MPRRSRAALLTVPRVFVLAGLVTGLALLLLTPPLGGFDETAHFLRAYEVSDGRFVPHRDEANAGFGRFPRELNQDLARIAGDLLLPGRDRTAFLDHLGDRSPGGVAERTRIGAIAGYNPLGYIPAAIAIRAGRLVGASTTVLIYLARIANLVTYLAIAGIAVARARRARWLLTIAALVPVGMAGATTVTVDGITYALLLLVVAMAIRGWSLTDRWRRTDTVVALSAAIALGMAKPPYALVALVFVPQALMGRRGSRVVFVLTSTIPVALMVAWSKVMQRPLSAQDVSFGAITSSDKYHPYTNVDPTAQLRDHVIGDPIGFLGVLGRTVQRWGAGWLRDAPAQLRIATNSTVGVAALVWAALAVAAFISKGALDGIDGGPMSTGAQPVVGSAPKGPRRRAGLALLAFGLGLATLLGAYVSWNAVGSPLIYAYQGRYLLPLCLLLSLAFVPSRAVASANRVGAGALALSVGALGWYCALVVTSFY